MQTPDEDPRSAFVRHLPRKIVEIKATLGAVLADPRQLRMRDELRRRAEAVLTIARAHQLHLLSDGLQATIDSLTESRTTPALDRPQLDRLTSLVASLSARAELDTRDPDAPGVRAMAIPLASHGHHLATRALITSALPLTDGPGLLDFAPTLSGRPADSVVPVRGTRAHATQVLFVGSSIRASSLLDILGQDADVVLAQTADEAVARARDSAPDIIVAEDDSPYDGVSLAALIADDPLVRFIPVVVIACDGEPAATVRVRCPEALDVLETDVSVEVIRECIRRALRGSASQPPATSHDLGDLTLDELIRALQDELRRGLVGAALPTSRAARVPLGAGDEVLAATWDAIARIRSVVERRSGGTVRFDLPIAPRGLPGAEVFTPGADVASAADEATDDPLPGRLAVVVDDDPAVVAQFSELLRGAGMIVSAHTDGAEALAAARAERPDVIIADILMPGVDGFALCRAIRRDVALRHTPVILLSWRDDLLVRMRELGAQAAGYLRKEAAGSAVLGRVRSTLRGRVRTLKRIADLAMGAEVRGRLERVGSVALIEATAKTLGDATISLADAVSVTDLEVRQGALLSAVRTVQDGSLARGESALARALGLNSARFVVRRASHPVRENISGKLAEVLERSARSVTALEEAVSGAALLEVLRVEFDADGALEYARSLPSPLRVAVERMVQGDEPRDMVMRDGLDPQDLEPLLIELARRGAIQRVVGRNREDLAAAKAPRSTKATAAARENFGPVSIDAQPLHGERNETIAKVKQPMTGPATTDTLADAVWRELRDTVEEPARPSRSVSPAAIVPTPKSAAPASQMRWETVVPEVRATRPIITTVPPKPPPAMEIEELPSSALMVVLPDDLPEFLDSLRDTHTRETRRPTGKVSETPTSDEASTRQTAPSEVSIDEVGDEDGALPDLEIDHETETDAPETALEPIASRTSGPAADTTELPAESLSIEPTESLEPTEPALDPLEVSDPSTSAITVPASAKQATASTTTPFAATTPAEASWARPMLLLVGVATALALSYSAVAWYLAKDTVVPPSGATSTEEREVGDARPEAPAHLQDAIPPSGVVSGGPAPLATVNGPYREVALFLDGSALPATHGLLVIPAPGRGGGSVEVSISRISVGAAPLQRVLREGFYSVQFRVGRVTSNQFVVVRHGLAAVLSPPTER